MNAGNLDQLITIEQKQVSQDPVYGTEVITWVPLVAQAGSPTIGVKFRAQMQDVLPSRSEAVKQGLTVARNQTRCRIRWRDGIDSSMRVIHHSASDVTYSIVGGPAEIGGRRAFIEMVLERYSS